MLKLILVLLTSVVFGEFVYNKHAHSVLHIHFGKLSISYTHKHVGIQEIFVRSFQLIPVNYCIRKNHRFLIYHNAIKPTQK